MSCRPPRIEHGEIARVVAPGTSWTGRALNLSTGGAFISGGPTLEAGRRVTVDLELGDGAASVELHARVAWCNPPGGRDTAGIGVRFVRVGDAEARRISKLVDSRGAAATSLVHDDVRVQLAGLPTRLRAHARELSPGMLVVEAELAWLQIGATVQAEVAPGHVRVGRLQWIGVEAGQSGAARLCLHVELAEDTLDLGVTDDDGEAPLEVEAGAPH